MAASKGKRRLAIGDILEVQIPQGLAYVQYVGRHDDYGDTIRVIPGWRNRRTKDYTAFLTDAGYIAFYPARAAVSQGLVEVVASSPLPNGVGVPGKMRRAGAVSRNGAVLAWLVTDGEKETLTRELTAEECELPIGAVWPHDFLVLRLSQGWTPRQESHTGEQTATTTEDVVPSGEDNTSHTVQHYLYFSTECSAESAGEALRVRGFIVEVRPSADGINWLVLATHQASSSETGIVEMREIAEEVAREIGGEYDGWEAEVRYP